VTYQSDQDLLVVHALRLKGFAPAEDVAAAAGVTTDVAETALQALASTELAR
jgi:hypothetical protein